MQRTCEGRRDHEPKPPPISGQKPEVRSRPISYSQQRRGAYDVAAQSASSRCDATSSCKRNEHTNETGETNRFYSQVE
jgi:hypothetical protein